MRMLACLRRGTTKCPSLPAKAEVHLPEYERRTLPAAASRSARNADRLPTIDKRPLGLENFGLRRCEPRSGGLRRRLSRSPGARERQDATAARKTQTIPTLQTVHINHALCNVLVFGILLKAQRSPGPFYARALQLAESIRSKLTCTLVSFQTTSGVPTTDPRVPRQVGPARAAPRSAAPGGASGEQGAVPAALAGAADQ